MCVCVCDQELLKHCREERYRCELQEALDSMLELLKSVNDSMHQIAITGYQVATGPLDKYDAESRLVTARVSVFIPSSGLLSDRYEPGLQRLDQRRGWKSTGIQAQQHCEIKVLAYDNSRDQ